MEQKRYALVYQAGIANVFEVDCLNLADWGRNAKRIAQADFRTCENIALGLGYAGHIVYTAHCNQAGDIAKSTWSERLDDAPFCEKFQPVHQRRLPGSAQVVRTFDYGFTN